MGNKLEYSEYLATLIDDTIHNPSKVKVTDVVMLTEDEQGIYMDFLDKQGSELKTAFSKLSLAKLIEK